MSETTWTLGNRVVVNTAETPIEAWRVHQDGVIIALVYDYDGEGTAAKGIIADHNAASALADAVGALRAVEWEGIWYAQGQSEAGCALCGAPQRTGHDPGCLIGDFFAQHPEQAERP